jgi:sulfur relay protein TusB/DsrH
MLQLVFQSPLQASLLQRLGVNDAVLFLENAVFALLQNAPLSSRLTEFAKTGRLYVLRNDLETRGITAEMLISSVQVIDYKGFVDLSIEQPSVFSWK